jgi:enoyl-CoA hydratase/carnithine racemase
MRTDDSSDILIERRERVGWIWFNRPDVANAARLSMMAQLCSALDELTTDDSVRAIVLAGKGRHFLAGAEFGFLQKLITEPAIAVREDLYTHFQGATRRLFRCPKPTIAAIRGAAITVGCEIAIACDFRVCTTSARFEESWIKVGLIPPLGGAMLLPQLVGLSVAKQMILEGRSLDAQEAFGLGFVSSVEDEAKWEEATQARAVQLGELPGHAYRTAKEAIHRGLESSMETEWASTIMAQSLLISSADFRERVAKHVDRA